MALYGQRKKADEAARILGSDGSRGNAGRESRRNGSHLVQTLSMLTMPHRSDYSVDTAVSQRVGWHLLAHPQYCDLHGRYQKQSTAAEVVRKKRTVGSRRQAEGEHWGR